MITLFLVSTHRLYIIVALSFLLLCATSAIPVNESGKRLSGHMKRIESSDLKQTMRRYNLQVIEDDTANLEIMDVHENPVAESAEDAASDSKAETTLDTAPSSEKNMKAPKNSDWFEYTIAQQQNEANAHASRLITAYAEKEDRNLNIEIGHSISQKDIFGGAQAVQSSKYQSEKLAKSTKVNDFSILENAKAQSGNMFQVHEQFKYQALSNTGYDSNLRQKHIATEIAPLSLTTEGSGTALGKVSARLGPSLFPKPEPEGVVVVTFSFKILNPRCIGSDTDLPSIDLNTFVGSICSSFVGIVYCDIIRHLTAEFVPVEGEIHFKTAEAAVVGESFLSGIGVAVGAKMVDNPDSPFDGSATAYMSTKNYIKH